MQLVYSLQTCIINIHIQDQKVARDSRSRNCHSPRLGQSSQGGSTTPALHASQNQGSVEHDDTVLETDTESLMP